MRREEKRREEKRREEKRREEKRREEKRREEKRREDYIPGGAPRNKMDNDENESFDYKISINIYNN